MAGAGAVGCHYGSLLQQAGGDVWFFCRGQHLRQLQKHGLHHVSLDQEHLLSVQATDDPAIFQQADVIFLTCKMTSLTSLLQQIKTHVSPSCLFISMQNGVVAPLMVSEVFPTHPVLAASAFIGVRMPQAAYVVHSTAGHVVFGAWQHVTPVLLAQVVELLHMSGISHVVQEDIPKVLWHKMLWNCGFNAFSALTRRYAKDLAMDPEYAKLVRQAMLETLAVAQAKQIDLDDSHIEKQIQQTKQAGLIQSSMWQDIEAAKPTEIDFLNAYIVAEAKKLGLSAPVNAHLSTLIHALQAHGLTI